MVDLSSEVGYMVDLSSEVGYMVDLSSEVGYMVDLSSEVGYMVDLSLLVDESKLTDSCCRYRLSSGIYLHHNEYYALHRYG
jgi:hypothetical protein